MVNTNFYTLEPYVSQKVWGYEKWIVSTLKNQESTCNGKNLSECIGGEYPLLIKLIQANDTLSVQVHPNDEYAKVHENSFGKTECWYILDAEPGATLISGVTDDYDKESFKNAIKDNTVNKYLYQTPVSKGDFIFIPAGTVHAIQGGLRILEIQQPSDVTYRLYDWGRPRELHVQKSLDVILPVKSEPVRAFAGRFACDYFAVEKITVDASVTFDVVPCKNGASAFSAWFVVEGSGTICAGDNVQDLQQEQTFVVNNSTSYKICCKDKSKPLVLFKMDLGA